MKRELQTGIRYIKVGRPDLVKYFSQQSINLYDPERAGWVRDDGADYSAPEDVINFMQDKPVEAIKDEMRSFDTMPTRELKEKIHELTLDELNNIKTNDKRKTAVRMAEEEIAKR